MEQNISTLKLISSCDKAGNVRTFIFETNGLIWIAEQNQGYTLPQAGANEAENQRWFTIASAPAPQVLCRERGRRLITTARAGRDQFRIVEVQNERRAA